MVFTSYSGFLHQHVDDHDSATYGRRKDNKTKSKSLPGNCVSRSCNAILFGIRLRLGVVSLELECHGRDASLDAINDVALN